MKKYSFLFLIVIATVLGAQAQNRKQIAQFSLYQQYFNPALTGYEGSMVKTYFRDQWTGFEGAPRTFFISGELNMAHLRGRMTPAQARALELAPVKNALGMIILRDHFGPFQETQFHLSYGSRVRITRTMSLRAGLAMAYQYNRLHPDKVRVEDVADPEYQQLFGAENNRTHKLDVNAGLMLTDKNFYFGYAIQDLAKGALAGGRQYYQTRYPLHHVVQGGYRKGLTKELGLVFNGIFRYDTVLKQSVEAQVKGVWDNTFWAGAGYRHGEAITLLTGVRIDQFRLGFAREMAVGKAEGINAGTNEVMLTYHFVGQKFAKKVLSAW
ncbi:MAG: PorP/SprF family type IX secretion system membrane protein [Adhaeribacter sp.]